MTDIDREIAEKVMGWTTIRVGYMGTDDETPEQREHQEWLDENNVWSVGSYYCDFPGGQWRYADGYEPWSPSTRIDHAWEVLEQLRAQRLDVWISAMNGEPVECTVGTIDKPITHWRVEDNNAPLAICRAALSACGEGE